MLDMFLERSEDNDNIIDVCSYKDAKDSKKSIDLSLYVDTEISISHYSNVETFLIAM